MKRLSYKIITYWEFNAMGIALINYRLSLID